MEKFVSTYESVQCECGGRHNNVPVTRQIHYETKKHRNWRWRTLCCAFINPDVEGNQIDGSIPVERHRYEVVFPYEETLVG